MMFAPKAVRPSPGRTMRMKPSHMSGRSSMALPLAVSSLMRRCSPAGRVRSRGRRGGSGGVVAAQQARGAGLLAGAGVAVQGAALDGLVDGADQRQVLGLCGVGVAGGDRGLEPAEEGLDRRGVAAVLQALAFGPEDALLL